MPTTRGIEAAIRQAHYWWNKQRRTLADRPKQRIVLLHVPKCAGTSLTEALSAHFPPHLVARLQTSVTARVAAATGRRLESYRQELLWYLARSRDFELISGHVGFHPELFEDLRPRWSFITLLRDPVERFLSSYFYRTQKASPHAAVDLRLDRYIETRRARHSGAIYVRYFAGDGKREPTQARVDRAIDNLRQLQLVGTTNRLPSFCEAFRRRFGFSLRLPRRNTSVVASAVNHRSVAPALRQRIEELCTPDRQVFDQVCSHMGA